MQLSSYRSITSDSDLKASEPSTAINLISRSPWILADSLTISYPLYVPETTRIAKIPFPSIINETGLALYKFYMGDKYVLLITHVIAPTLPFILF